MTTAVSTSRSWPQLHGRTCDSSPGATAATDTEGLRPPSATLFLGVTNSTSRIFLQIANGASGARRQRTGRRLGDAAAAQKEPPGGFDPVDLAGFVGRKRGPLGSFLWTG